MPTEWHGVSGNGFPCDFCDGDPVGWIKVKKQDRSHGGNQPGFEVYMVCADHLKMHGHRISYGLGVEAVYPVWRDEPVSTQETGEE